MGSASRRLLLILGAATALAVGLAWLSMSTWRSQDDQNSSVYRPLPFHSQWNEADFGRANRRHKALVPA